MKKFSIIRGLRWFNDFKDELLIELSSILLMLGFIAGTVDILSARLGLSKDGWFMVSWSIVQAIAIDGLFFAIWARVRETSWSTHKRQKIWYVFIGILLAVIAALVNNILSYQELNHVSSVSQAMNRLGINQETFSYTRSILVVVVSVLVATLPRAEKAKNDDINQDVDRSIDQGIEAAINQGINQELQSIRSIIEELQTTVYTLQSAKSTKSIAREKKSIPLVEAPKEYAVDQSEEQDFESMQVESMPVGYMATDDGDTLRAVDDQGRSMVATGGYRDMIKEAMLQDPGLRYQDIANNLGIALATVKKHGPSIKQEIAGGTE